MTDVAKVDIYNEVLGHLGSDDIVDAEDSNVARLYRLPAHYNASLKKLLSLYDWGFATVTAKLQLESGPANTQGLETKRRILEHDAVYRARWTYPADCMRLIDVGFYGTRVGEDLFRFDYPRRYVLGAGESGKTVILTQWPNACAKYVTDSVLPAMWPPTFRDAVVAEMAARMSIRTDFAMQLQQAAIVARKIAETANRNDYGTGYYPSDFVMSRSIDFVRDGYR